MARKTKNPPSETDVLLTNYIDQTLGNTGKIGWSSEEVSGMVQREFPAVSYSRRQEAR